MNDGEVESVPSQGNSIEVDVGDLPDRPGFLNELPYQAPDEEPDSDLLRGLRDVLGDRMRAEVASLAPPRLAKSSKLHFDQTAHIAALQVFPYEVDDWRRYQEPFWYAEAHPTVNEGKPARVHAEAAKNSGFMNVDGVVNDDRANLSPIAFVGQLVRPMIAKGTITVRAFVAYSYKWSSKSAGSATANNAGRLGLELWSRPRGGGDWQFEHDSREVVLWARHLRSFFPAERGPADWVGGDTRDMVVSVAVKPDRIYLARVFALVDVFGQGRELLYASVAHGGLMARLTDLGVRQVGSAF